MRKLIIVFALLITIISLGIAQDKNHKSAISFFAGVQNPIEVTLLDLNGNGPKDIFKIGTSFGVSYEINRKFLGIKLTSDYLYNALKNTEIKTFENGLHSSYHKGFITFSLNKFSSKSSVKIGLGPGILFQRLPANEVAFDVTGEDGNIELLQFSNPIDHYATLAACSFLSISHPVNDRFSIVGNINTDGVIYYGDEESAIFANANIGLSYNF